MRDPQSTITYIIKDLVVHIKKFFSQIINMTLTFCKVGSKCTPKNEINISTDITMLISKKNKNINVMSIIIDIDGNKALTTDL